MTWYRMDNFDNKQDQVVSSAYEYVMPTNNGFVMVSDELMGFGFASYSLGKFTSQNLKRLIYSLGDATTTTGGTTGTTPAVTNPTTGISNSSLSRYALVHCLYIIFPFIIQ